MNGQEGENIAQSRKGLVLVSRNVPIAIGDRNWKTGWIRRLFREQTKDLEWNHCPKIQMHYLDKWFKNYLLHYNECSNPSVLSFIGKQFAKQFM